MSFVEALFGLEWEMGGVWVEARWMGTGGVSVGIELEMERGQQRGRK